MEEEVKDFKHDAAPDKQVKCQHTQMVSTQKALFTLDFSLSVTLQQDGQLQTMYSLE